MVLLAPAALSIVQARPAVATAPTVKPGQVLSALVVTSGSDGTAVIKAGDLVLQAQLPQQMPPGTVLQLRIVADGVPLQLAMVGQPVVPPVPVPTAPSPMPVSLALVLATSEGAKAAAVPAASSRPAAASRSGSSQQPTVPLGGLHAPDPLPSQPRAPGATPQLLSGDETSAPVSESSPAAATTRAGVERVASALPADGALLSAGRGDLRPPALAGAATTISASGRAAAIDAGQGRPVNAAISSSGLVVTEATSLTARANTAARALMSVAAAPAPSAVPTSGDVILTRPEGAAARSPSLQAAQSPVAKGEAPPEGPPVPVTTAFRAPAVSTVTAPTIPDPEEAAPNPLLIAQALKQPPQPTDLPKSPSSQPGPVTARLPSATPAAAVAEMVPAALGRQDSLGPLLVSLASLVARGPGLTEAVARAAVALLAQRLVVNRAPDAEALRTAIARSGSFLESTLLGGGGATGDTKAALGSLKAALAQWLGSTPPAAPAKSRVDPPLRDGPLRAIPSEAPALPEAPRDLARALHGQADAALSRIKLLQAASLPDTAAAARNDPQPVRLELPLLIGHELAMVQMQIGRDGSRRDGGRKRGWLVRFAMTVSGTGEVGAEIGLFGGTVNVALWAAEPETASRLKAMLPNLALALEAAGLAPGTVRLRRGAPIAQAPRQGQVVDAVS